MEKLKRVVIKEELVALTGDYRASIILNQFIYWSERVKDFDKFIDEENTRLSREGAEAELEKTSGWIYKKADELIEECMLETTINGKRKKITNSTLMQYIDLLIENGWIDKRLNPKHKWDRTYQYRVNLMKINNDLNELGYQLQDYKMPISVDTMQFQKMKFEHEKNEIAIPKNEIHILKNEIQTTENWRAIPETTTEITNKDNNIPYQEIYDYYLSLKLKKHRTCTDAMKKAIKSAMRDNKYTFEYCKVLLDRHKRVVEITKKEGFPVKARALDEFFGQKVMNAKHLICSEYDEGGSKYETYLRDKEEKSKQEHKPVKVVIRECAQ